jgi:hypothetical protein
MRIPCPRLSYANVMATIAVFIALGGASYAAFNLPKNSVGTKQLKANAVVSSKVKDNSLKRADFEAGQLPLGPVGPQGPPGQPGPRGPSDGFVTTVEGPTTLGSSHGVPATDTVVATLSLPAGNYEVSATGILRSTEAESPQVVCRVSSSGATGAKEDGHSSSSLAPLGTTGDVETTALLAYASSTEPFTETLHCQATNVVPNGVARIEQAVLSAISIASLKVQ